MEFEEIDRREILAAVAAITGGLAGCSGTRDTDQGTTPTAPPTESVGERTATTTPPPAGQTTDERTSTTAPSTAGAASFERVGVAFGTDTLRVGETTTLTVTIENTGTAEGTLEAGLTAGASSVGREAVTLPPGERTTVEYTVRGDRVGSMEIQFDGEPVGELTVRPPAVYHVHPEGDDDAPGTEARPLATIDEALDRATPGNTIDLAPGEYREVVATVRDGEPDAPITITGPPEAVIRPPPGASDCVKIEHSHVHLRGMTIDGLLEPDRKYEDYEAWSTRCVFVSPVGRKEEGVEYIYDAVVEPARIGNTAGPIVQTQRIRDSSIGNFEVIGPAGMRFDDRVDNYEEGHVREIVYIGSPAPHRGEPYYKYETLDRSRNVRIHHIDNSDGYRHNELVDVKLGSTDITVEYCTTRNAGHNSEGAVHATIDLKGNDCTVRWNDLGGSPLPFSLGAWAPSDDVDGADWSRNNEIYGNDIHGFVAGPFRLRDEGDVGPASLDAQRVLCGNRIERGSLDLEPWIGEPNGFDEIADLRGQEAVTIDVGAGPEGHALDPPVYYVDPGTDVTWEWTGDGGEHYILRQGRIFQDPADVPDPKAGSYAETHTIDEVGVYRFACYVHHDEGMRAAVIAVGDGSGGAVAREGCEDLPEGDGIGHTGGDSRWA